MHQQNLGRSLLPNSACPWGEHTPKHCPGHKQTSLFKLPFCEASGTHSASCSKVGLQTSV